LQAGKLRKAPAAASDSRGFPHTHEKEFFFGKTRFPLDHRIFYGIISFYKIKIAFKGD
jgi:hypothetical protein